jgi:hypothetical protein
MAKRYTIYKCPRTVKFKCTSCQVRKFPVASLHTLALALYMETQYKGLEHPSAANPLTPANPCTSPFPSIATALTPSLVKCSYGKAQELQLKQNTSNQDLSDIRTLLSGFGHPFPTRLPPLGLAGYPALVMQHISLIP